MPGGSFDVESKERELNDLRERAASPDLWNDPDAATELTRRLSRFERLLGQLERLGGAIDDGELMLEMADEESDAAAVEGVVAELSAVDAELGKLEIESLYFGEYDDSAAIVSVHAGAGGVDAQDWAEMLLRMYLRFLENEGFAVEVDEITPGDEAGIKSATFTVKGDYAYGTMEGERGVHRLVRISPFDANSRRHTSFAGVDVIPEVGDAIEIEISPDDLRIDTFRSQGAGGQHVNTTDSAVRITHLPTNTVVACQAERSQIQNRARAMTLLKARLADLARQQQRDQIDEIRGEQTEAGWGRQLRSYVMQPYQLVKDLRTEHEIGNIQGVLDGDIRPLVEAYLHWRRARQEASS